MDREQKTITTAEGKELVVKAYLTGRENNELKAALLEGVTVGAEKDMSRMPLANAFKREEKLLAMAVISYDGSKENPAERITDLPSDQYDAIIKQIESELKLGFQKAT